MRTRVMIGLAMFVLSAWVSWATDMVIDGSLSATTVTAGLRITTPYLNVTTGTATIGTGSQAVSALGVNGGVSVGTSFIGATAPSNGLIVSGNTGIGTNNPSAFKLQVEGNVGPNTNGSSDLGSTSFRYNNGYINNIYSTNISATNVSGAITPNSFSQGPVVFGGASGVLSQNSNLVWDNANARLGIGTSSPSQKLDINGWMQVAGRVGVATGGSINALLDIHGSNGNTQVGFGGNDIYFTGSTGGIFNASDANGELLYKTANSTRMTIKKDGKVGIGTYTPAQLLSVNGRIRLDNQRDSVTLPSAGGTELLSANFSNDPELRILDSTGDMTRLNSHADPRSVDAAAKSSFNNPEIVLPFSFKHENIYLGKGQIVDLAKMAAYTEKKMKAELGDSDGQLVYTYDLPPSQCADLKQYNEAVVKWQTDVVLDKLESMPLIKAKIGENGQIPAEAFEEVPVYELITRKVMQTVRDVDCDSMKMVNINREVEIQDRITTGKTKRQLRVGWTVIDGELYRRPTVNDINIEDLIKDRPHLPQWILERIKVGQQTSMDVHELSKQIRQILAAKDSDGEIIHAANVNR